MIMRSWERYCFHFRLPAARKKAAALDKKRSLIFQKDVLKIGASLIKLLERRLAPNFEDESLSLFHGGPEDFL